MRWVGPRTTEKMLKIPVCAQMHACKNAHFIFPFPHLDTSCCKMHWYRSKDGTKWTHSSGLKHEKVSSDCDRNLEETETRFPDSADETQKLLDLLFCRTCMYHSQKKNIMHFKTEPSERASSKSQNPPRSVFLEQTLIEWQS